MTRQTIEHGRGGRKSKPAKTVKRTGGKDKAAPQKTSRRQQLHKMLCRKSGVTIAQLQTAFGWQPHRYLDTAQGRTRDRTQQGGHRLHLPHSPGGLTR